MNPKVLEIIDRLKSGKIPYRYDYDKESGLYFGLAILAVIFIYALAQSLTARLVG